MYNILKNPHYNIYHIIVIIFTRFGLKNYVRQRTRLKNIETILYKKVIFPT